MRPKSMGALAASALAVWLVAAVSGCTSGYVWRPQVPESLRTVSVPTFRNESDVQGLGSAMARQVLREFQREGTFSVAHPDDAAYEVQGIVKSAGCMAGGYDRRSGLRLASYNLNAVVEVSVIDRRNSKVLIDNRSYSATAVLTAGQDLTTARRDASGRLAEDLARQVVDDVTGLGSKGDTSSPERNGK